MTGIRKYPRTQHILDSRLQPGDEGMIAVGFAEIAGAISSRTINCRFS